MQIPEFPWLNITGRVFLLNSTMGETRLTSTWINCKESWCLKKKTMDNLKD